MSVAVRIMRFRESECPEQSRIYKNFIPYTRM